MDRRALLAMGLGAMTMGLPRSAGAQAAGPDWRSFEVTTRIDLPGASRLAQAWAPVPTDTFSWFKPGHTDWTTNGQAVLTRDPASGAAMVHVRWEGAQAAPFLEVTSRGAVRDRAADPAARVEPLSAADRRRYTAGSPTLPIDGIVQQTSERITAGAATDEVRARAIYEWVVENTHRDPKTGGCGAGDIRRMLQTGDMGGKCADINALYVGLARAAGLPARDLYGLRVAPSVSGRRSLGANSPTVTKAQHCRAEVYLTRTGWTAVDPADVRKFILEEPPGPWSLADAPVDGLRKTLFGAAEGNWIAYNSAHDVVLPGSDRPPLAFLMYPEAEVDGQKLDCLNADAFKYAVTSRPAQRT